MTTPFDEDDPTPKATPGKRPAAPPKPAAKSAGKGMPASLPVAEPAGPEHERLPWGHVGSVTRPGRLSDGTSRPGVIRIVEAGISYYPPPLEPYVWTQASLNYVGQYEMSWPEGDPGQVRSLADLAGDLKRSTPSKPQLKLLDNIAYSLLATTEKLHESGWRLGLLQLGNVLLVPASEGRGIVLPDLGFVWRGSHGQFPWKDSPGRPRWLDEDARQNPNARLWDEEPAWQQFPSAEAAGDDQELVPSKSDLKTLARLFAAILTGHIERDPQAPLIAAPVWGVLRAALSGYIDSAGEFRTRLREHPLSEQWIAPTAQATKSSLLVVALLALLSLFLLSGAALYLGGFFNRDKVARTTVMYPKTTMKETARPSRSIDKKEVDWKSRPSSAPAEIGEQLRQLDAAKDPKQLLSLLVSLYDLYERSDAATRDTIRGWVEYWRGQYLDGWESRYRQADDAVIKNIGLRFDVGRQVYELYHELTGLREQYEPISPSLDTRERACLLISDLRSRELGSPR